MTATTLAPAGFTARTVDNAGVRLATRDHGGDGPALVLMHGAGMEQGSLQPLVQHLRSTFRVVTFDFRGHGGSDLAPWTVATAVDDVSAVAASYGLGVPAVAGHSLGGMVAAAYAREHPACPRAVNIDGHGRGRVEQHLGCAEDDVRAWWREQDRKLDRFSSGPGTAGLQVLSWLLRKKPAASMATAREVIREVDALDLFALYGQVPCPLLVFNATASETRRAMKLLMGSEGQRLLGAYRQGLSRDLAALAADNPLFHAVEVDASHMLIRTHPALVARRMTDFLLSPQAGRSPGASA